jgi:hypothetical protein
MLATLAMAMLLGAVLGYGYHVAALILVSAIIVLGGIAFRLSLVDVGASILMVQLGYAGSSFIRVSRMHLGSRAGRTRSRGVTR